MKKKLTWTFKCNELLNDVEGKAYLEGYVMKDDADPSKHSTQDILVEGTKELVIRSMDLAAAEAKEFLHPYTQEDVTESETADDTLTDPFEGYTFNLCVPDNFSKTTQEKAVLLIHDYIVNYALWKYFMMVNPEASAKYNALKEENVVDLNRTMNKRTRPTRISLCPGA